MENALAVYQKQSSDVLTQAESIEVKDQISYDTAAAFNKVCLDVKKKIIEEFKGIKKKTDEAHKQACADENKHLGPVMKAIGIFKRKMTTWYTAEQDKIREEEDRLRRELIRQQEDERLKQAEELSANGQKEEAEEVLSAPIATPVFVHKEVEKPKGVSYRDNWKFRIVDEQAIPRPYLMPDESKILGVVKATKDKTQIPGIEVYNDRIQVG